MCGKLNYVNFYYVVLYVWVCMPTGRFQESLLSFDHVVARIKSVSSDLVARALTIEQSCQPYFLSFLAFVCVCAHATALVAIRTQWIQFPPSTVWFLRVELVVRVGGKHLHLLSHFTIPIFNFSRLLLYNFK